MDGFTAQQCSGVEQPVTVRLFGGPLITSQDRHIYPPEGSKRLLALLAFREAPVLRQHAAAQLWPTVDKNRADANLRTALWRLHGCGLPLVDCDDHVMTIRTDVTVDVQIVNSWARRVLSGQPAPGDLRLTPWVEEGLCVLPGWYDDWVIIERERFRQHLLLTLESLSRQLHRARRFAQSVEVALVAVAADPLREGAQRALVEAHLAEGNLVEAHRAYRAYRTVLGRELGAQPSPGLAAMIADATRDSRPARPLALSG